MAKQQNAQNESDQAPATGGGMFRMAANWSIAGTSIAVLIAFGFWMVSLGTRDPNEVPIIRAMEGPARVQPSDPGGKQANYQGLAVNSVQAKGGVEKTSDQVALAPSPEPLNDEDVAGGVTKPSIAAPVIKQPQPDVVARIETPALQEPTQRVIGGTRFSPAISLRPAKRPAGLVLQLASIQPAVASPSNLQSIESVPLGTRLIQLGAYDSTEMAIKEWAKLFAKHGDLLEGKKRLVQSAESGGRKFFRLRAAGFASKDETRTLCSALLARGTPCIPVTAR